MGWLGAFGKGAAKMGVGAGIGGVTGGLYGALADSNDMTGAIYKGAALGALGGLVAIPAAKGIGMLGKGAKGAWKKMDANPVGKLATRPAKGIAKFGLKVGAVGAGVGAMGLAFGAGVLTEPYESGALTHNLDIHSGPMAQYLNGLGGFTAISTKMMMNSRQTQGATNLSGQDYMSGLAKSRGGGGPVLFNPAGYEKPVSAKSMGIDGNLSLSLSNLRRGR